jgi:hypothetical protein
VDSKITIRFYRENIWQKVTGMQFITDFPYGWIMANRFVSKIFNEKIAAASIAATRLSDWAY